MKNRVCPLMSSLLSHQQRVKNDLTVSGFLLRILFFIFFFVEEVLDPFERIGVFIHPSLFDIRQTKIEALAVVKLRNAEGCQRNDNAQLVVFGRVYFLITHVSHITET